MAGSLDRNLNVNVSADTSKFQRGMKSAASSAKVIERELKKQEAATAQFKENTGRAMVGAGAAILAGAGLAVRAAVQWESSWAGVQKTVDGSAEQMAKLEGELREMARTLPASHEEIAAVAEAAGQLGIERENVAAFTKTMIDLGETTNLTAEQAATMMARFGNVMGTAQGDVDRLGASLVQLGNNSATTEAEIMEMGLRLSGAGKQLGLTEGEVLGLSAALSSVGIRAEAGGSSVSSAMIKIAEAVDSGSSKLDTFATVAGMSTSEFKRAFEEDAGQAITAFITGLGKVDQAGVSTFAVLDELGLGEIRVRDAMLRLSASGDLLATSLEHGNQGWSDNIALVDEAAKRYATTESQMQIARNNVNDLGITLGETLLPVLGGAAKGLSGLVEAISSAPEAVQHAIGLFGSLAGLISIIGGGALIAVPKVHAFRATLEVMGGTAAKVNKGLGKVGSFLAGPWGAAIAGATILAGVFASKTRDIEGAQRELADALRASNGEFDAQSRQQFFASDEYQEIADVVERAGISHGEYIDAIIKGGPALEAMRTKLDDVAAAEILKSPTGLILGISKTGDAARAASGHIDILRTIITGSVADWEASEDAAGGAAETMAEIPEVTEDVDPAMQALGESFGAAAEEAAKAAQEMVDAWAEAVASFIDSGDAYQTVLDRKEESERETAEKTADATKKAGDSWEDYVKDVKVTAEEYIAELEKQVKAQRDWKKNMIDLAARVPAEMLDHYARLGPEGAAEVQLLHDMTDKQLQRVVQAFKARSDESASGFARNLADAQPILEAITLEMGKKAANRVAEGMRKNGGNVFKAAEDQGILIDKGIGVDDVRVVYADVNAAKGIREAHKFASEVNEALSSISDEQVELKMRAKFQTAKNLLNQRDGGAISGPGGPRDDLIPAMLSDGEHVIPANEVQRAGGQSEIYRIRETIRSGGRAFRDGGEVVNTRINARGTGMGATRRDIIAAAREHYSTNLDALGAALYGGSGSIGAGVERWRGVALQALALAGSPLSWIDSLLRRMNQESGGNPMAINLWDSNAAAGIPSKGLMQTIDPTFNAYAGFLRSRGVWDPLANIFASINYANARYGSAPVGWNQPGGYDDGGLATGRGFMMKQTLKPERVLNPEQTKRFDQLVQVLDRSSTPASATPVRVEIDYDRLADAVERKRGPLKVSGRMSIDAGRNGGLVGVMRDVAAEEARDEMDWRN